MAHTHFLDFEIHLRDEERVLELQANPPGETSVMPNGQRAIIRAPLTGAAIEFGNSDNGGTAIPLIRVGAQIPTDGPYITSTWFTMADPYVPVANCPLDAATFVLKQGGWFGIPVLFPQTIRYYWRGVFVYDPPLDDADPGDPGTTRSVIMQRRFLDPGPGNMCGNREDTGTSEMSRAAGRWPDSFGFAVSGQTFTRQNRLGEYQTTTPASSNARRSWERLYIRLRQAGAGDEFWRCEGGGTPGHGARMDITPSGQIAVYNVAASTTLLGTTDALEVGKWYKLDIVFGYADGGGGFGAEDYNEGGAYPGAGFRLFLNNEEQLTLTPPATGLGSTGFHNYSQIGTSVANSTMMLDIGFWMNAQAPIRTNGIDFMNGSRPVLLRGDTFSTDHDATAWPGSVQVLSQVPGKANSLAPVPAEHLASATALGRLAIVTDAERAVQVPGSIGLVAFTVTHRGHGNLNGQIGYRLAGGADVLKTMGADGTDGIYPEASGTQTAPNNSRMMWNPAHGELPPDVATDILPLELLRIKGNDGNTSRTFQLQAVAELIGVFGNEDYPSTFDEDLRQPIVHRGVHNSPFPRTAWASSTAPPISNVTIKTGTYVGTGTDQTLTFKSPVNFLWIRSTSGNPRGARWWPSMHGPTSAGAKNPYGWMIPRIEMDPAYSTPAAEDQNSFQSIVRLAGTDAEVNSLGVTYCYTSVMDPGMRFMLASAMWHIAASLPKAAPLIVPSFTPLFALLLDQRYGVYNNDSMFVKGPGHATNQITSAGGTDVASGLAFGAGEVTHLTGLGAETWKHIAAIYFRRDDGSGDAGVVRVFGMGSYTGNGVASRDILVSPVSERRPIFIIVVPNGATGYYRDCQMPTTESKDLVDDGTVSNTAIIGGTLNGFSVGITLNANAVLYHYFVIWGGETAGNGGMSQCGEFDPVPPDKPPCVREEGEFDEEADAGGCDPGDPEPPEGPDDPDPPDNEPPGDPGGGDDDIDKDLDPECLPFTARVADIALAKIGWSRRIAALATDTTEEALAIRLHLASAIKQTLRDFPWPFATRLATLELIGGSVSTPFTRDWAYAYRQPADCVFERRIAVTRDGAIDPVPPPFQLAFKNLPNIENRILTNQAGAMLEYTARPECSAGVADPLFLEALSWKLAQLIAPALSKMADREKYCQERYDECVFQKAPQVIRPGNPGPRGTSSPDSDATHQAANVSVVNRALVRIGARSIKDFLTEQSHESDSVRLIFEGELRGTLRDYPWPFCTRYAKELTLVQGVFYEDAVLDSWSATVAYQVGDLVEDSGTVYRALLAGTGNDPASAPTYWESDFDDEAANDDWTFAYRLPTDCVFVRRLVQPGKKRAFDPAPPAYKIGQDPRGMLLFTELQEPTVEYTSRITGVVYFADELFRSAFAWRLAACLAPSLATMDPTIPQQLGRGVRETPKERKPTEAQMRSRAADYAWQMYRLELSKASAGAGNEQQRQNPSDDGDPDFIRGRS